MTVEIDRICVALTTSGVTWTMSFGMIEHATGLLHKIRFFVFLVRCFLSQFLVFKYFELSKSRSHLASVPLNLGYVRILSWSISFFPISIVSLMILCVTLLSELIIHHMTKHLAYCNKLRWALSCNLILKIKIVRKYFYFSSKNFLILKCQDLVLKVIYSSSNIRSCYPELADGSLF